MYFSQSWCFVVAVLCVLASQFVSPSLSHADAYSVLSLQSDNGYFLYGMDDAGHVVFDRPSGCDLSGNTCYYTFLNGLSIGTTLTAPVYTWDYATVPCFAPPCSVSKNGRTASFSYENDGSTQDLFVSSGADPDHLLERMHGVAGLLAINGVGDIVFDNGALDEWFEAINVSAVPAP